MRVKGENVSSVELEQILLTHPDVTDCAVVPIKSDIADNEILAVVVVSSATTSIDPASLYAWCADQTPHYMVPRFIRLVQDMPRGHSGKVEKHKLRAEGVTATTWDAAAYGLRATRKGIVRREIDR
jgi:crotonobetaine/carnitine-CoA ligase